MAHNIEIPETRSQETTIPINSSSTTTTTTRTGQERFEQLKEQINKQEGQIQHLQTLAFQLANYFFVFQGVIIAAISNSKSLTCSDTWFVFLPSFVVAILTMAPLFTTILSYVRSKSVNDKTWSECNELAGTLELPGPERVRLREFYKEVTGKAISDNDVIIIRYVVMTGCMVLLLVFTGGMLSAHGSSYASMTRPGTISRLEDIEIVSSSAMAFK